jgi:hypothetical protein
MSQDSKFRGKSIREILAMRSKGFTRRRDSTPADVREQLLAPGNMEEDLKLIGIHVFDLETRYSASETQDSAYSA